VDIVVECTGHLNDAAKLKGHLDAGAAKVVVSATAKGAELTVVMGVNHDDYDGTQNIISNASCTTNCLTPMAKPLFEQLGPA
jgi:glyceraldehyde 3-phosphate dehydrogenase (phosphorylating)